MPFRIIFFFCFILLSFVSRAQFLEWARSAGELSRDAGRGVCVDNNGNVIVTGYFSGKIRFDGVLYEGRGTDDAFVAKYNSNGDLLWVKTAGGPLDDVSIGVAADAEGNIFIAGSFDSIAFFDNVLLTSTGGLDGFIAKYSPEGNLLWVKKMGGVSNDAAFGVAADNKGNAYVIGDFQGFAAFGNSVLTSRGNKDVFVVKFDGNGNVAWSHRAGGNQEDLGLGIAADIEGGCYITGAFKNSADFGTDELFTPSVSSDIFIAKIDSAGIWEWAEQAGSLTGDAGYAITVDKEKNAYITGYFSAEAYFGTHTIMSRGYNDIFVAKYGAKGLCLWATNEGYKGLDIGTGIAVADDGSVFACGSIDSFAYFGNDFVGTGEKLDIFLAKWNRYGEYQWVTTGGGPNFQLAMAAAKGKANDIYVTGYYYALLQLDDTTLVQTQDADMFLLKYNDPLLSVAEKHQTQVVSVYPNPAENNVFIKVSSKPEVVEVTDNLGRRQLVNIEFISENILTISMKELTSGIYFVHCIFNNEVVTKQVLLTGGN